MRTHLTDVAGKLLRRKRDTASESLDANTMDLSAQIQPSTLVVLGPADPAKLPAAQATEIQQSIQDSRMRQLIRQLMDSPYMPTREQLVPITTTIVTLALMMALGPALGSNTALVNAIVKQIVPIIVGASIKYAADYAVPVDPSTSNQASLDSSIAQVDLQPVIVPQSAISQTI